MSDAIIRLLLNTGNFDRGISKSKQQISSFSSIASSAGAGMLKFAGAIGAAVTVGETFNKIMNSSQTLSDEYARTMDGLKGGVDQFFYSLGSGDWSNFLGGLKTTIELARDAYTALDQLGNTTMSYSYFSNKNMADAQEQITVLKDKKSTNDQREEARKKLDAILSDQQEIVDQYQRRTQEGVQSMVEAAIGFKGVDVSKISIEKILRLDVSEVGDKEKERLGKEFEDFQKEAEKLKYKYTTRAAITSPSTGMTVVSETTDYKELNKALGPVIAKYQDAIQYNAILVKKNDDWLKQLISLQAAADIASRNYQSMVKSANRASQAGENATSKMQREQSPKGSLAELDEQIKTAQKKYAEAASDEARKAALKTIEELKNKKVTIEFQIKYTEPPSVDTGKRNNGLRGLSKEGDFPKKINVPDYVKLKQIKDAEEYAKAIKGIGYAMEGVNSIAQASGNQTVGFITESFASIAQMIISLNSLAVANGVANAAALPFPANIAAIATVVSTIAGIFSSLPKFADGGIIGGSSFFGDKMIARVNSGEMILNQSQQGKLFNIINNGNPGNNITVGGEAKVSGKTMYIAIRNYMKSENVKW